MAHYPVLWDGQSNVLYAGTASLSVLDRLQTLFRETFDRILEPISAGSLARSMAEARGEAGAGREPRADRLHRRGRPFLGRLVRHRRRAGPTSGATSS